MNFLKLCILCLWALPMTAAAQETTTMQEVEWDLVDAGILNHPIHGRGIEMQIKPDIMPEGLFEDEAVFGLMASLCDHYAPVVISFVRDQTGMTAPDFVAVRLLSGDGAISSYLLQAYTIVDLQCGEVLS